MKCSRHRFNVASGRLIIVWVILIIGAVLQGCATPPMRGIPLPQELSTSATIPDIPDARRWGDERPSGLDAWLSLPKKDLRARYAGVMNRPHSYLVISGGGADGAYGAGLLCGWTDHGTRPEFQIVTGISTGALIAPFAFLGSDYDPLLREVYTRYSTRDLVAPRSLWQIIRSDSAMDTTPLRSLIAQYFNDDVIKAIAAEGRRGRSLLVGTSNLDAARPVIWDITRIADSGAPGARDLIHDVILASASIPGAFPPVLIEVEANGQLYDEMHVDGGVMGQLFFGGKGINWDIVFERLGVVGKPALYLIRNGRLRESWESVEPRLLPVVSRTVSSLIRTQGIGDLAKVYILAEKYQFNLELAHIPEDFTIEPTEPFDREYMRALFELGYERARTGRPWTSIRE
jgi:hypothetical protein